MEAVFRSRSGSAVGGRWRRKFLAKPQISASRFFCGGLLFFLILFIHFSQILRSILASFPVSWSDRIKVTSPILRCRSVIAEGEKFVLYSPHSGFSNQVAELRNGIVVAALLNRTLVVPPVLDHHAVALGSCPKFRVSSPTDLRVSVWDHIMDLLRSRRFVSMADIVDLSSLVSSSTVKIIDFRAFVAALCGVNLNLVCAAASERQSLPKEFNQCKDLLSRPDFGAGHCSYGVEDDCRTTVWTYGQEHDDLLDQFQPGEELKRKKKIKFIRRRRDIFKALGPGSTADAAKVLAFGSLFSSPYKGSELYFDIHDSPKDSRIESLLRKLDHLPFTREILDVGKELASNRVKKPFLCAQLRLLDGQFKNHWKETFAALREKIELLMADNGGRSHRPISIFIMTDLPEATWSETFLGELMRNSSYFELFTLSEDDKLLVDASRQLISADHISRTPVSAESQTLSGGKEYCPQLTLPSILLYVQEVVCSCASLGFVGTSGSTIAENIEAMRKNNRCNS
ncbi:O-fucosyltransferase family protein [Wolffia australiana]